MSTAGKKMEVEIWSDVMCPFCYIGKRKFEAALAEFPGKDQVAITWKSFQLSPHMVTDPAKNIHQYLAEHKGISLQEAERMNDYVTDMAAQVGLAYRFDQAIVANSMKAHRFSHYAKTQGKQDEAEERLFSAYFTEGKNTDDLDTLVALGEEIGLDGAEVRTVLESDKYTEAVRTDIYEAQQVGVRGVPFFAFDRKYGVSGAQDSQVFLQTLQKSFDEWKKENVSPIEVIDGPACAPGEDCA